MCIRKNHVCEDNKMFCYNCKLIDEFGHKCYILTEEEINERDKNYYKNKHSKKDKFAGYIYFDFETRVDPVTMIHYPMLLVALKRCLNCLDLKDPCVNCKDYFIFYNLDEFL
jgi:hypothetical protein